jgi:hypothetical protein
LARTKWKLAQILLEHGGSKKEEADVLLQQSHQYVKENSKVDLASLDAITAEAVVDWLVFCWSR